MKILGIETSCDETAASVVEDGTRILSNVVVSQIDIHAAYGGVVPEVAARSHIESILPVIHQATAGIDYDAIAVTHTPGLNGSLLIGTLTARTLALLSGKPLYPTHHLKSHIYANWLENPTPPEFPIIALVISGGHTQLIYMRSHNHFQIIGTTLDDAVGEAFDKAAKILGLPYPGGPSVALAADKATYASRDLKRSATRENRRSALPRTSGHSQIFPACNGLVKHKSLYRLPIPKVAGLDFSFSGLKTALLRAVQQAAGVPLSTPTTALPALLTSDQRSNFAAAFQQTAITILKEKLQKAIAQYHPKSVILGGGVSANKELRKALERTILHDDLRDFKRSATRENHRSAILRTSGQSEIFPACNGLENHHVKLFFPPPELCGDNAAMVSAAAHFSISSGQQPTSPITLEVSPHTPIH